MERWNPKIDDRQQLNDRAGLGELFEPCHDPLPGRMAELTKRIEEIDQAESNLTFSEGTLSALWRDDNW
jgi:hypothetical protein